MKFIVKYWFAFLFLFVLHTLQARTPSGFPITSLGMEQGLSNNSVLSIYQDHRGFMWFGTRDGLNQYNGYSFRVYRNKIDDPNSLVHTNVSDICEDKNGRLWLGTRQGVSIFDPLQGTFVALSLAAPHKQFTKLADVIKIIVTDKQNNIFVATENSGLLICKNASSVAEQIPLYVNGVKTVGLGIQSVRIDTAGRVWVFVQNAGLCTLDYSSLSLRLVNTTVQSATSMAIDGQDIWISTLTGVYHYLTGTDSCTKAFDVKNGKLSSDFVTILAMDKTGRLWIGTKGAGICLWNKSTRNMEYLQAGDSKYSLTNGSVYAIVEDNDHRMWIGTLNGGINIIDPLRKRFQSVAHDPGAPGGFQGNIATAFLEAPDSSLWIGTEAV